MRYTYTIKRTEGENMDINELRELMAAGLKNATGSDIVRALCAVEMALGGEINRNGWSDTCEELDGMAIKLRTEALCRIG
jgi:hypothetical protein